jgi:DNA-binding MarR family transcriptional regulator
MTMKDGGWTFMTSHAVLLIEVSRQPDSTVRALAERAGLTERQTHRVLADLVDAGYLERTRIGRRNQYRVNPDLPMRHPVARHHQVGELLEALQR